jgi:hypothetical protein
MLGRNKKPKRQIPAGARTAYRPLNGSGYSVDGYLQENIFVPFDGTANDYYGGEAYSCTDSGGSEASRPAPVTTDAAASA